jgi:hypothetical protein
MHRVLVCSLATFQLLTGCASVDTARTASDGDNPSISGSHYRENEKLPNSIYIWPIWVDGAKVQNGFAGISSHSGTLTTPGVHKIVAECGFGAGYFAESMFAIVEFEANLLPGHDYFINGHIEDDQLVAWLVDAKTGERLPYGGSAKWSPKPRRISIPILIPSR